MQRNVEQGKNCPLSNRLWRPKSPHTTLVISCSELLARVNTY